MQPQTNKQMKTETERKAAVQSDRTDVENMWRKYKESSQDFCDLAIENGCNINTTELRYSSL